MLLMPSPRIGEAHPVAKLVPDRLELLEAVLHFAVQLQNEAVSHQHNAAQCNPLACTSARLARHHLRYLILVGKAEEVGPCL